MATKMKQFDKWWNKTSMEGDWDYEEYAKQGWEAALEWVKSRSEYSKELYMIWANDIDEELDHE